ncbi:hypothetical protein IVB02_34040 [Bradyrhizobium sp. 166]|uniref:hypothetical protein n=1 Tax=Bradyrhizobium sp. 166 TaxID=2782638 RepID=UPI001FF7A60C|nr:hypothetical protein [Bradyrhizobium sp. 166]MCK1606287.1 hypothetical protein [Bradyrhizobium sp. 166]
MSSPKPHRARTGEVHYLRPANYSSDFHSPELADKERCQTSGARNSRQQRLEALAVPFVVTENWQAPVGMTSPAADALRKVMVELG